MAVQEWERPRPLIGWVDAPSTESGVHFEVNSDWTFSPYPVIAEEVRRTAGGLLEAGLAHGDRVAVMADDPSRFLTNFFGVLYAGATVVPTAPLSLLPHDYSAYLSNLLDAGRVRFLLCDEEDAVATAAECRAQRVEVLTWSETWQPADSVQRKPDLAMVQFTSGSTGRPRGVCIAWDRLELQMEMITRWMRWTASDGTASWLPAHHDLGLIGCLIAPVCTQTNLWLMRPERFILRPRLWLECLGGLGATMTAAPNFAYAYAARRLRAEHLEGLDFSGWRVAINAAERLEPAVFKDFAALAEPFGFDPTIWRPAYGLAEATLGVTGHRIGRPPTMARIDWSNLRFGAPVEVCERRSVDDERPVEKGTFVMSSGQPMYTVDVSVVDADGGALPDRHLGEIVVSGPSISLGYTTGDGEISPFVGDRFVTGDAGFVDGEELYVLGRILDSINVRGRIVYVDSIEARIAEAAGIATGRCVVVPSQREGGEIVVAIVETKAGDWVNQAAPILRQDVGESHGIQVLLVERGSIPKTTSGKPKRRQLWRQLLGGGVPGTLVVDEGPVDPHRRTES